MKSKALIIGALPLPFEGPWVVLEGDRKWEFRGLQDGIRLKREDGRVKAIIWKALKTEERVNVFARELPNG